MNSELVTGKLHRNREPFTDFMMGIRSLERLSPPNTVTTFIGAFDVILNSGDPGRTWNWIQSEATKLEDDWLSQLVGGVQSGFESWIHLNSQSRNEGEPALAVGGMTNVEFDNFSTMIANFKKMVTSGPLVKLTDEQGLTHELSERYNESFIRMASQQHGFLIGNWVASLPVLE